MLEAVYLSFIGSSLRGVPVSNLVRKGQLSGQVILYMEDLVSRDNYRIERSLFKSKSSKGKVFKNDELLPVVSVKDIKETVLGILGLSAEQIQDSFILTKFNYSPFLSLTDSKMRAVINRMSNISSIDYIFDNLKDQKIKLDSSLRSAQLRYSQIEGAVEMCDKFTKTKLEEIENSDDAKKIRILESEIISQETIFNQSKEAYEEHNSSLEYFDLEHANENKKIEQANKVIELANEKVTKIKSKIRGKKSEIQTKKNSKSIAKAQVDGSIVCPKCEHEFVLNGDIKELKKIILEAGAAIKDLEKEINLKTPVIEKINSAKEKALGLKTKLEKAKLEKEKMYTRAKHESNLLHRKMLSEESNLGDLKARKLILEDKDPDAEISKLRIEMDELMGQLKEKEEKVTSIQTKIDGLGEWKVRFTKFKHYLLTKVLDGLNYRINLELSQINPSLSVKLDGFKIDSKGKISEKIDTSVFQHGEYIGNYANFSGGEKVEINVATIFARNKMILEKSDGGLDFVAIDEIIESLDSTGVESIAKYLNNQEKTVLMITHASTDKVSGVDVTIVEKKGGVSRILK
jgi:DNA repair exonuclease SbcCD ATPase subunit